jgi:hypothetical protein
VFLAIVFGVVLCAIGGFLAWRSYETRFDQVKERVANVANEAGRASGQFLRARTAVLQAVAEVPLLDGREPAVMRPVLDALASEDLGFGGGIGWVDLDGVLQVATSMDFDDLPLDVSDRDYVRHVLEGHGPYVGRTRVSQAVETQYVPIAVPTHGSDGATTGVLVAAVRLDDLAGEVPALVSSSPQIRVVDRSGEIMLENGRPTMLEPPANLSLLEFDEEGATIGRGLKGDQDRIVAVARVPQADWLVVVEQGRVTAMSAARGRLFGELAVLVAFTLLTLGAALMAAQQLDESHRQMIRGARDLGAMEVLSETLATAPDPRAVADAAIEVFSRVFDAEAVLVGLVDDESGEMRVLTGGSSSRYNQALPLGAPSLLTEALRSDVPVVVDAEDLAEEYPEMLEVGGGSIGVVAARFSGPAAGGAVAVYLSRGFPPDATDLELFESMTPMLGDSFGRALAAEREHLASRTFQEALLPQDSLGLDVPLQRAVRYQAAVSDVEVGGDWYDLWMVDDHRVGLVVGDVVGRGVVAAAAMGQLRSALRATVGPAGSPADALGHVDAMTRQITGSPGATVILGVLDVRSGAVRLASAGHLPPLLATGEGVSVLNGMSGTPVGFFSSAAQRDVMTVKLEPEDTLVFYSDGLVERRDEDIDAGIERLAEVLDAHKHLPVEALADALVDLVAVGDNPDDVALICARPVVDPARHFTAVVPFSDVGILRESLAAWLDAAHVAGNTEILAHFDTAASTVVAAAGDEPAGGLMVEVDPDATRVAITVEYRMRAGSGSAGEARRILRGWGSGELTPRGPRTTFVVQTRPAGAVPGA